MFAASTPRSDARPADFLLLRPPYLVFSLVSLLLVMSAVTNRLGLGFPYERACDVVVAVLIVSHAARLGFALPRMWSAAACASMLYVLGFGIANAVAETFQLTLFLLDGKLVLCIAAIWAFIRSPLTTERERRRLASIVYFPFCAAIVLYVGLGMGGASDRLALLDESNYMMLAFCICSIVFIDTHRIEVMSPRWIAVIAMLFMCSIAAQSRTGFVMIAVICGAMLWNARRYKTVVVAAYAGLAAVMVNGDAILDSLTRGERDIDQIDRFVFVNELLFQWSSTPWWDVLFGNHIGTYMTNAVTTMHYWVGRQSAEQGIAYGLAPFNFHALFLRMPADLGLIPGVVVIALMFRALRASVSPYVVAVLFVSCFSMSVFYLSSVLPFIVLAQILRPLSGPARPVVADNGAMQPLRLGKALQPLPGTS